MNSSDTDKHPHTELSQHVTGPITSYCISPVEFLLSTFLLCECETLMCCVTCTARRQWKPAAGIYSMVTHNRNTTVFMHKTCV